MGERRIRCLRRDAIPKVRLNEDETLVSQQPQTVGFSATSLPVGRPACRCLVSHVKSDVSVWFLLAAVALLNFQLIVKREVFKDQEVLAS